MAAHQAPPSLGFSRQEHWSGLPFPSPMHESESEVTQSCPTPSDPMDCSLPGSSIHGVFQARVLELGAIAFSKGKSGMHQKMGTYQPKHVIKSHPSRMRARVWRARAFQDWGQGTLSFLVLTPQILLLSCLDLMSNSAY